MHAVILAGGRGTRLRPITDYVPKPLVPISNRPLLEWQLRYLESHGVRSAVLCTGYKAGQIADYLSTRGARGRMRVAVSVEDEPLGTGGAVRAALGAVRGGGGGPFAVINGDVITDIDMGRLGAARGGRRQRRQRQRQRQRRPSQPGAAAGVVVAAVPLRTRFGVMLAGPARGGPAGGSLRPVSGFLEKAPLPDKLMNAGIYLMDREAAADLPERGDIERTLFPEYAAAGRLSCVEFAGARWHSIDSFKDIEECAESVGSIIKHGGPRRR